MIEASMMINDRMPEYCVERAGKILNRKKKAMNGAQVLLLGVSYKQDIDDYRVWDHLKYSGAKVSYYDPWVPECTYKGRKYQSIPVLSPNVVAEYDLVIITTGHTNVDYEMVQKHAQAIFDTKNVMKHITSRDNIEVL